MSSHVEVYNVGATKMWDIGGDEWDLFDVVDIFKVVSFSLDKLELEVVLFNDIIIYEYFLNVIYLCYSTKY